MQRKEGRDRVFSQSESDRDLVRPGGMGIEDRSVHVLLIEDDPYSPWRGRLWQESEPEMRDYICEHAARRPSWCDVFDLHPTVQPARRPETYGPTFTADDARWIRLIRHGSPETFDGKDVAFIRRRAETTFDPVAMEILGFLYAQGYGIPRDPVEAYIWYGRAYLEGQPDVKPNMDLLWREISKRDKAATKRIEAYFADYRPSANRNGAASAQ